MTSRQLLHCALIWISTLIIFNSLAIFPPYVLSISFSLLQDGKNSLHIFRTEMMPEQTDWTPTAWRESTKATSFRLPESPRLRSLMEWHYLMSVINCWGSLGLKQLVIGGFREAGDDKVAETIS